MIGPLISICDPGTAVGGAPLEITELNEIVEAPFVVAVEREAMADVVAVAPIEVATTVA